MMNTNDSKPSKNSNPPSKDPVEKRPIEPATPPITPPLASPEEPTRAYPAEPSRTYSSDPSQYSYPNKPPSEESPKIYTTEPLDTARIARDESRPSENQAQKEQEKTKDQTSQTFYTRGDTNQKSKFYTYATSNKEQTITYILLILGLLILLFVNNLLGGLIIGMVTGYFFSSEIIYYLRNLGRTFSGQNHLNDVVLTGLLLGLFIGAPGIFIGAVIVASFKQVMTGPNTQ